MSEDECVSIVRTLARDEEGPKKLRNTHLAWMLARPLCDGQGQARAPVVAF
jgi:hypothetical protein